LWEVGVDELVEALAAHPNWKIERSAPLSRRRALSTATCFAPYSTGLAD